MQWSEQFLKDNQPSLQQIGKHIGNPLWQALCTHLENEYGVQPRTEHSGCGGAPGWNIKYKKSSRALCTLYPHVGYFTCLVSVGAREAIAAELLLTNCTSYMQELYRNTSLYNGGRWLMVDVTTAEILEDVKRLIALRTGVK